MENLARGASGWLRVVDVALDDADLNGLMAGMGDALMFSGRVSNLARHVGSYGRVYDGASGVLEAQTPQQ